MEEILKILEDAGVENAKEIAEQIQKEAKGDVRKAKKMAILASKLATVPRLKGVIIGASELRDLTAGYVNAVLTRWKNGEIQALLQEECIQVDEHGNPVIDQEGNPIVIDNRKTIGDRPNPNYGKPVQPYHVREVWLWTGDGVVHLSGALNKAPLFTEVSIPYNPENNRIITSIPTTYGKRVDVDELFEEIEKNATFTPLDEIEEAHEPNNATRWILVKGFVTRILEGRNGVFLNDLDNPIEEDVLCFYLGSNKEPEVGDDVITVARTMVSRSRGNIILNSFGLLLKSEQLTLQMYE